MEWDFIAFIGSLFLIPALYIIAGIGKWSILTDPKKYIIVFAVCVVFAVIGLLTIPYNNSPNFYLFLICPLYSISLYRLLCVIFKSRFGRDPILTGKGLSANPQLQKAMPGWDDFFNACFFFLSIFGPVLMLAIFVKAPPQ